MLSGVSSILVTGGSGFVGSWLVRALLEQTSARVVVLDNFVNGKREFLPAAERLVVRQADLTRPAEVLDVVRSTRPEVVFHLAALHFIPYCNAHPAETLQVNVVGTQHLLDACRVHEPHKLVAVSTVAVYPVREGPNAEDSPVGPVDIYGLSKWVTEKLVEQFAAQVGTRCVAARLSNVYGPHETNPHVLPDILEQLRKGQNVIGLGNVKPKRDYIYVTDVAQGLLTLAEKSGHSFRVYNVGTGSEYSVEEIVAELARVTGRPLEIAVAQQRVRASDRPHLVADTTRMKNEIGWSARYDLASGLAALWRS